VDRFAAAAHLRSVDPAAFGTLTRTPVTFSFSDDAAFLSAHRPITDVDPAGRIRQVRVGNRSMQPGGEHWPEFYRALLVERQVAFRLARAVARRSDLPENAIRSA
jgi:gamma-butyrobetaine dioxygenase